MSLTEALRSQLITGLEDGSIVPYIGAGTLTGVTEKSTGNPIPADSDSLILAMNDGKPALEDVTKLWHQQPYRVGKGHFSHRLAFAPANAEHAGDLFITSGERQKQDPAQEMDNSLGKVIRIKPDGSIPPDNPFADDGEIAKQFYSVGHRNMLGIAFDADGTLWTHEMGPAHGDELNRIESTAEAEEEWTEHVHLMAQRMLFSKTNSWFTGINSNIEGRDQRSVLLYAGGAPGYRDKCDEVAATDYAGFVLR